MERGIACDAASETAGLGTWIDATSRAGKVRPGANDGCSLPHHGRSKADFPPLYITGNRPNHPAGPTQTATTAASSTTNHLSRNARRAPLHCCYKLRTDLLETRPDYQPLALFKLVSRESAASWVVSALRK